MSPNREWAVGFPGCARSTATQESVASFHSLRTRCRFACVSNPVTPDPGACPCAWAEDSPSCQPGAEAAVGSGRTSFCAVRGEELAALCAVETKGSAPIAWPHCGQDRRPGIIEAAQCGHCIGLLH